VQYIVRCRFITVLKQVYGFGAVSTSGNTNNSSSNSSDALAAAAAADEAVEKKLHRLYTAFDTHRTDACEWRLVRVQY
jgi:hypothetical protein